MVVVQYVSIEMYPLGTSQPVEAITWYRDVSAWYIAASGGDHVVSRCILSVHRSQWRRSRGIEMYPLGTSQPVKAIPW